MLDDQRRCLLVNEWVTRRAAAIGDVTPGMAIDRLAGVACDRMVGVDLREQVTIGCPESTFIITAHTSGDGHETVIVISNITEERAQQAKAAHQDRLALIGQLAGTGRVIVRIAATEPHVTIEVADTGSGMAPDVAARVFEPYFTTKALGKGTGLGLATVHGIVQQVGGEITVTSELGRGTTFRIALPRTNLAPEHTRALATGPAARGRVLVVDDDDQLRRLVERMLRNAGYHVVPAASGPEALAEARRQTFDILLTDMVMPGMSCRDLARELVQEHPNVRVVYMSGYQSGTPLPDWQFIAKPFDRQILLAKIGNVQPAGELRAV